MKRLKNSFHEPTFIQQKAQKLSNVFQLINHQEQSINDLLEKYNVKSTSKQPIDQILQKSKTLQPKQISVSKKPYTTGSSATKLSQIQLPMIPKNKQMKPLVKKDRRAASMIGKSENPYNIEVKNAQERVKLKQSLQKVYNQQKKNMSNIKSRKSTRKNLKSPKGQQTESRRQQSNYSNYQEKVSFPLPYFEPEERQLSQSSEQGEVPLTYYEREYRELLKGQCTQEINFLYFSKNQSIKNWSQNILLLFEKHDKQLYALRQKCRYLKTFDKNYFSIDVFRQ